MSGLRPAVLAGAAGAAVALPQAMGLGASLWGALVGDAATGAVAGMLAGAALSLASGAARATAGMVSAPTGPTFVLLLGAAQAFRAAGAEGGALLAAVAATVALGGVLQGLLAVARLGELVKFIPYPVVSGFMTGAGVLMVASQWKAAAAGPAPLAGFAAAVLAMRLAPKGGARPLWAIAAGVAAFHATAAAFGGDPAWMLGRAEGAPWRLLQEGASAPGALPLRLVVLYALAFAVLASLDTLLTAIVADLATGRRHRAGRELAAQGAGHLLAAGAAGMGGAGTTGATLVAIAAGGREGTGIATGAAMLLAALLLGPWLSFVPLAPFAGLIAYVGLTLLDRDILLWLRTPAARADAAIALIVAGVTVAYDLMVAVGLGVLLAIVEFIRTQARHAVIVRRWTRAERPSVRRRPREEDELLARHAEAIVGFDLKGVLFFGTAERLREAVERENEARFVILDMRRVLTTDLTAVRIIEQLAGSMREGGRELLISHAPASMQLVRAKGHRHEHFTPLYPEGRVHAFAETNEAVEYAEDRLLASLGVDLRRGRRVALAESPLLAGLDPSAVEAIARHARTHACRAGEAVFRADDHGESLYVVLAGEVEVWLRGDEGERMRVAVYGPGMAFGELAFLEPGPRMAEAVARADAELAEIARAGFAELAARHPKAALAFTLRLAHEIARHLRQVDAALLRLQR